MEEPKYTDAIMDQIEDIRSLKYQQKRRIKILGNEAVFNKISDGSDFRKIVEDNYEYGKREYKDLAKLIDGDLEKMYLNYEKSVSYREHEQRGSKSRLESIVAVGKIRIDIAVENVTGQPSGFISSRHDMATIGYNDYEYSDSFKTDDELSSEYNRGQERAFRDIAERENNFIFKRR
ncbi:MAG: hypothetical protein JKY67_13165 [Pseudomonadales bacterium]|nr:hypothetical protein [Pseudomonadales bacterium]